MEKENINLENSLCFYNKSVAFIDTAILIASNDKSDLYNTSDYQDIINYHIFHAFELFLKFSILLHCKDKNCFGKTLNSFSHNLEALYNEYRNLYKEKKFNINNPFNFRIENINGVDQGLYEKHISQYPIEYLDQYFKYPYDKKGKYTGGAYLIKFEKDYIDNFKNEMEKVFNFIMQKVNN